MAEDKIGNYKESTKSVKQPDQENTDIGVINRSKMQTRIEKQFISDGAISTVTEAGAEAPEHDPELLKSYARQTVASIVISTISKDASAVDYNSDVDLDPYFERSQNLRYAIDEIVTSVLETGRGYMGLERDRSTGNDIDEVVVLDPSTIFVERDDFGRVEQYIHKPRSVGKAMEIDKENILEFKWSGRYDKPYPEAPIVNIRASLERLQEIEEKEITQLREGSPRGVLTMTEDHDTIPLGADEWETARNVWEQSAGELHKDLFLRGKFDYVRTSMGIDELDLDQMYKRLVKEVCNAFHVSPSYAGFTFSEGGIGLGNAREQDRVTYQQKGLRMILKNVLEGKLNELVKELEGDDASFTFVIPDGDSTPSYYNDLAKASLRLQKAGIPHEINEDDNIETEDEVELRPEQVDDDTIEDLSEELDADNTDQEKIVTKDDVNDLESLGYKQIEFMNNYGKPFAEAVVEIINKNDTTKARIDEIGENVNSKKMSNTTYYNWLEDLGIKELVKQH